MHRTLPLLPALLAGFLPAQSNTVPGLDGRLTEVNDLSYWGRRGSFHPGGEIGMSMRNTMCNAGSVEIPWEAAMLPDHPFFGFLIVRESNGRMVQISDRSFCKHAFTSLNTNGACGTCVDPLTGTRMGIRCSDTYSAGNNANRMWLGPADEIDPWLGVWDPIGSYFDRGDPPVPPPGANDGVYSLNTLGWDEIKNRVTVKELDLLAPGSFYYGVHLLHRGEAAANRGDNMMSRGFVPSWNGSVWSFANNAVGQVHGSILQHWSGATLGSGRNGSDNGTFYVAVKVAPLGGGWHRYEYAVHNADNSRGAAAFRLPVDSRATVSNFGFRDLDGNLLNDWTGIRIGNEIAFTAAAGNPLNWNSIFNFWFDCDAPPSSGSVQIDQARIGPGALTVTVGAQVPSGQPAAYTTHVGVGCGDCVASFYELFGSAGSFDLANMSLSMQLDGGAYRIGPATGSPAGSYVAPSGTTLPLGDDDEAAFNLPFTLPHPGGSTAQLVVCSNGFVSPGFGNGVPYEPVAAEMLAGARPRWAASWHDYDPTAGGSVIAQSTATTARITWLGLRDYGVPGSQSTFQLVFESNGTVHVHWRAMSLSGNTGHLVGWSRGGLSVDPGTRDLSAQIPAGFELCASDTSAVQLTVTDRPVLGTTVNMATSDIPPSSPFGAVLLSLTLAVPPVDLTALGMPGCWAYFHNGVSHHTFIDPPASVPTALPIPNLSLLTGATVVAQSFVFSFGANPLSVLSSNGAVLVLGVQ